MAVSWPEIAAHRERLVRVARRRVPTREDAEDVVHEAMVRCATFEELDEARMGQFLTAVTMRLCADLYRHSERSARAFRRLDADDVPSPEEAACAAAEADAVRALLASLPDKQRDVLIDRASGLSVSQISSRHALTYKAAESALSRARSAMRLALAAGLSFLGAVGATVRRRPSAVLAAPLTALAFVTTVAHTPYATPRDVALLPPSGDTVPVTSRDPVRPAQAGAPGTAATATARRGATRAGDDGHGGGGHRSREIARVPLPGGGSFSATENDTHTLLSHPDECVFYGMTVEARLVPRDRLVPGVEQHNECHPPPR